MFESTLDLYKAIIYPLIFFVNEFNLGTLNRFGSLTSIWVFLGIICAIMITTLIIYSINRSVYNILMVLGCSQVANCVFRYFLTCQVGWNDHRRVEWLIPTTLRNNDIIYLYIIIMYTYLVNIHLSNLS